MPSILLSLRKVLSLPQGLLLLCYSLAPRQSQANIFDALSAAIPVPELDRRQNGALGPSLRIVAIGDSITEGTGSTDMNSYRLDLRNALVNSGNDVDFIGTLSFGDNNPDNQNEGYGGRNISEITNHIQTNGVLFQHPNIALIHAGTNDMKAGCTPMEPCDQAPSRLGKLIDTVLCECPDAVVLVAKVVYNIWGPKSTDIFNAAIHDVVAQRAAKGYKVQVVDQSGIGPDNEADGLHPNDAGYAIMANNWFNALEHLPAGWLTTPRDPSNDAHVIDLASCSPAPTSNSSASVLAVMSATSASTTSNTIQGTTPTPTPTLTSQTPTQAVVPSSASSAQTSIFSPSSSATSTSPGTLANSAATELPKTLLSITSTSTSASAAARWTNTIGGQLASASKLPTGSATPTSDASRQFAGFSSVLGAVLIGWAVA